MKSDTTVYVYSDSPTGEFSQNGTDWFPSGWGVKIANGTTNVNFMYQDTALGVHQLTVRDDQGTGVDDFGWTNAMQPITVEAGTAVKVSIPPLASNVIAGQPTQMVVQLEDVFGNVSTTAGQTVYVTLPNPGTARIAATNDFSTGGDVSKDTLMSFSEFSMKHAAADLTLSTATVRA